MSAVVDWFGDPLQYAFMKRALVEVLIMGAVTGVVGTYIVLRGLSFIGDALSHAIFPGIVAAFLLGHNIFWGALLFGLVTSFAIGVVSTSQRVKEDTAIGVFFAGAFALGIVLISSSRNFSRDLASFLFGNVLGVTQEDILLSTIVGAGVIVVIVLFYKELLITSFDRIAAQAMGIRVFWIDMMVLMLTTLTIIVSLRAVGNILVLAMLVTPAATARQLTDKLPLMMLMSAGIGCLSGVIGLFVSFHQDVAAGGTIVLVATGIFMVVWLFSPQHGLVMTRLVRRRMAGALEAESLVIYESAQLQGPGR